MICNMSLVSAFHLPSGTRSLRDPSWNQRYGCIYLFERGGSRIMGMNSSHVDDFLRLPAVPLFLTNNVREGVMVTMR
jgi:hypothetical protein